MLPFKFNVKILYDSIYSILFSLIYNTCITEKEGKAVHLGYAEKCELVGLTQQVTHGPFDPASSPPVGVLDVVGKDRRYDIY